MKIDFSKVLCALDGEPFQKEIDKKVSPMTLGDAAVEALTTMLNPQLSRIDIDVPGTVKFERARIAMLIHGKSEVELTIDEAKIVKDRIGEVCIPAIIFPAWNILDQKSETTEA